MARATICAPTRSQVGGVGVRAPSPALLFGVENCCIDKLTLRLWRDRDDHFSAARAHRSYSAWRAAVLCCARNAFRFQLQTVARTGGRLQPKRLSAESRHDLELAAQRAHICGER